MAHINLNTISKENFAIELLMSKDLEAFYYPREKEILDMSFDFEKMKEEFEEWMEKNSNF